MRIQHPRATDAYARDAPSQYAVRVAGSRYTTVAVDGEGYMSIKPSKADDVMDGLEANYDVEYDHETGDVIVPETEDESTSESDADAEQLAEEPDASEDDEMEADADDVDEADEIDAWANWNKSDWLSLGYEARLDDVENGLVDDHLEDVIDAESNQSKQVRTAAEKRLEELEGE